MSSPRKPMTSRRNRLISEVGEISSPTIFYCLRLKWIKVWHSNPPGGVLLLLGLFIAMIMSIPILYVMWRSFFAGRERWMRLLDQRIPQLLWNTVSLTAAVTICAVFIGVSLAWLVIRTDIPGGKWWQWLLALPLVIPPYVGAVTYIIVFGRSGWARDYWHSTSWLTNTFGDYVINIYSFWGIFFVLTMFTYPYVFLVTCASLRKMNRNFEEAGLSLGLSPSHVFWQISLPLLRPAIGAAAILVSLYVLSDFGAIAMLRYVTFTAAIYFQRAGFDTASASVLSLVLILITILILGIESKTRKKNKYYQTANTYREPSILKLRKWKLLSVLYVSLVFILSVLLPIGVLVY